MRTLVFLAALAVSVSAAGSDITRETVLAQMNAKRLSKLLPPLREDARLTLAAEDRMHDMEDLGYWAHVSPDGRSPFTWIKPRGYDFWFAGENLASGFETAEVLVDGWMESEGHRDNILGAMYQDCGIAIIEGATTGKSTGKSVVVLFGRQLMPDQQAKK